MYYYRRATSECKIGFPIIVSLASLPSLTAVILGSFQISSYQEQTFPHFERISHRIKTNPTFTLSISTKTHTDIHFNALKRPFALPASNTLKSQNFHSSNKTYGQETRTPGSTSHTERRITSHSTPPSSRCTSEASRTTKSSQVTSFRDATPADDRRCGC